ncbi:MAG TPA: urease accessory protein UreD [Burkholderiaceae bacterium]|nr:urease accessory protein UreD [Burkholderiaceae bacterium]
MTAAGAQPSHKAWHGHLALRYRRDEQGRCVAQDAHSGPLRVLKALYPEGPAVCHHVLVHPPGGVAGGDELEIDLLAAAGSHALVTTPGATRFYRSDGAPAAQRARLHVQAGARLEWLPLEAIAFPGCEASNAVELRIERGGEAIGWDLLALGLPATGAPFAQGRFVQQLSWPGVWLERGTLDALDRRLLDGPLGLAGRRVLACAWCAAGAPFEAARRESLLEAARAVAVDASVTCGATSPEPRLVLWRALGERVEPVFNALVALRAAWRGAAWSLAAPLPRVWRT